MKTRGLLAVALAVVAGGIGTGVFLSHRLARSADHLDAPATRADSTIDINDVFTWMDGNNVVLIMTLYPAAATTTLFSNTAQYVFHITSGASYGAAQTGTNSNIICTFAGTTAPQTASCWAGTTDYVTGNANVTAGITSASTKFKVFAGPRFDPFFFNLAGFNQTVTDVENAGTLTFNDGGCPQLSGATSNVLATQLGQAPDGGTAVDFFKTLDALAIVVSIDKSLVTGGGSVLSVWGATYK